ncbi:protein translocase subunit SecD [Johnsonella ignava]|uniref:protein translocase subunit SecD n=1 Tax=Johnsonella ignava TaxID=43995 RepID=UPI0023F424D8|nr:protein translocase subunit SecD [Johnsonella ignava]
MRSNKRKGFLKLLVVFAALAAFAYLSYMSMGQIKLGLDLAGGVSITYQAVEENPSDGDMNDTIYKLQKRVQTVSTEAEVYREGKNRINIDIPGVSNANAILEQLGKPGSLSFVGPDNTVILTGDMVEAAQAASTVDQNTGQRKYLVELSFKDEGKKAFADATAKFLNQRISIVYDGSVVSSPVVRAAITDGKCTIDGMENHEEAENLASTIRIGSLSLELEELRSNVVGAKLGQDAIATSLKAAAIGFAAVALFMIAGYLLPGCAAVIALAIYVEVIICLLAAFEITLTLPGIAGIILSIGMAVDANVVIFARIKEEIGSGKAVDASIKSGYNKALSAIIDGNITTLIAAAVLFIMGTGTVKGFASTLGLGIILSMFTAIFVTRSVMDGFYNIGASNAKYYGSKKDAKIIDFLSKKYIFIAVSAFVIAVGFIAMFMNDAATGKKFNYSIDFKGGTSTNVTFNEDMSLEDISSKVVPVVSSVTNDADIQTQKVKDSTEVIIKTRTLNVEEREQLNEALKSNFNVDTDKITAESIFATVSNEMKKDAIVATLVATLLMLIYIWFRFSDIRFALSSVAALMHDVLVVITFYAVAKWSLGSTFIACILTIVGYSINATIVIFDRIRENLKSFSRKLDRKEIVNLSITQTLSRSINSSLTTFITIFILYLLGVSSIREFALPIMVGIVCGTYSSVCLAGAFWYIMIEYTNKTGAGTAVKSVSENQSLSSNSSSGKSKSGKKSKSKAKADNRDIDNDISDGTGNKPDIDKLYLDKVVNAKDSSSSNKDSGISYNDDTDMANDENGTANEDFVEQALVKETSVKEDSEQKKTAQKASGNFNKGKKKKKKK